VISRQEFDAYYASQEEKQKMLRAKQMLDDSVYHLDASHAGVAAGWR